MKKNKSNNTKKIIVAENIPTREQAKLKIKQLGELLSENWQDINTGSQA